MAVFRWVVVSAKAQGKMDTGVAIIEGERLERAGEPAVVWADPQSSAVTLVRTQGAHSALLLLL